MSRKKPHERLAAILVRLSRDRWLGPKEILNICRIAYIRRGWNARTENSAFHSLGYNEPLLAVGLLRGKAPAYGHEPGFWTLVRYLRRADEGRLEIPAELAILRFRTGTLKERAWKRLN